MKPVFPQDKVLCADTESGMKNLCVLYAGGLTAEALEDLCQGPSALNRSATFMSQLEGCETLLFLTDPFFNKGSLSGVPEAINLRFHAESVWTVESLFKVIAKNTDGFDHVTFGYADAPWYDPVLTKELFDRHLLFAAEYTFADGYPSGLAPELLAAGIFPVLARLAEGKKESPSRTVIFDVLKTDINSFDIETILAVHDQRMLRIHLFCDTPRNRDCCIILHDISAANARDLVDSRAQALRTRPAFIAFQIAGHCPVECLHCPYPAFCASRAGRSPLERNDLMDPADFSKMVDDIAAFCHDAVISVSLWGEPLSHPRLTDCIASVMRHPGLKLLIETTGIGAQPGLAHNIASLAGGRINWILSLDASTSPCWTSLHSNKIDQPNALFSQALAFTAELLQYFPGSVWPQMIRMKDNEEELEPFYRHWKEIAGRVIIQKHDHFCRTIADRRVADLSPLSRMPCWHLKRDLSVLIDGSVPLCREDLYCTNTAGNLLTDGVHAVWKRLESVYLEHFAGRYDGMCGNCDEYYTYNF